MSKRILNFEHNGKTVLGFDTGLNAQAFAQAKIASFITSPGFIVYPDGRVETWLPGGVVERETMFVWGPSFTGEELGGIINAAERKDEALNALCLWIRARAAVKEFSINGKDPPFPGPAGAFIVSGKSRGAAYPEGTVFFPPSRLFKRTLEADGSAELLDAEQWVHPDLEGDEAVSFSAGAMLYRIFSGVSPFPVKDRDAADLSRTAGWKEQSPLEELHQDIREAVFIPPDLAAPGLDPEMSGIISRAMCRVPQNTEEKPRPAPEAICEFIGSPSPNPVSSWIKILNEDELSKFRAEQEQYSKKKALAVKTRRFMIRNTAILTGVLIGLVSLVLIVRSYIRHRAELPNTMGMVPVEVAETYYNAFGSLDHTLMEACVLGKAGKNDIEMVINIFVVTRVRQAYETTGKNTMSAEEWAAAGRPATDKAVFGVTDLDLRLVSEDSASASFEADYILWMPGSYLASEESASPAGDGEVTLLPPGGLRIRDKVDLTFHKGAWRITAIDRTSSLLKP